MMNVSEPSNGSVDVVRRETDVLEGCGSSSVLETGMWSLQSAEGPDQRKRKKEGRGRGRELMD